MTEKEFRKLVSELELNKDEKANITLIHDRLVNTLKSSNSYFSITNIQKGGAFAKGLLNNASKSIDFLIEVELNNNWAFLLSNQIVLNSVYNTCVFNFNEITKHSDIEIDRDLNNIVIKIKGYNVTLMLRYTNGEQFHLLDEEKRIQFTELANRDYTYFRNTMQIIKYYIEEQKLNINSYLIEILLYYSLINYFTYNRYEEYILAFLRGIDHLIKGERIEVSDDIYQKLGIVGQSDIKGAYQVVDVVNPYNNIACDLTDIKIGEYRKLKKVLSKLVDTKLNIKDVNVGVVELDINPLKDENNNLVWSYELKGTLYKANGGSYPNNEENYNTAVLKSYLKGLKIIIEHNFNRKDVHVICNRLTDIMKSDKLSSENMSRRKNVLSFIEVNKINITYK